jgi:tRNA pseudouridine13 synthase
VRIEKSGDNTEFVARELATMASCKAFEVGFCGLKDRHAVTVQWFSLYCPGRESGDTALLQTIGARWPVLASGRHARKLRRGEHLGNEFDLVLRRVNGNRVDIEQALTLLGERGAPNYFGPQRFGIGGGNLERAVNLDPTRLNRKRGSRRGGGGGSGSKNVLYFSAARSWLFNEVLAARVEAGAWFTGMPGEPSEDGHPTGPLWGDGTLATGALAELERAVVAEYPEFERLFFTTRMKPERRNLVSRPQQLSWQWLDDNALRLQFFLPPGQYATTVLGDIFELQDMSLSRDNKQES